MNIILYNPKSKKGKSHKIVKELTDEYNKRNMNYLVENIIGLDITHFLDNTEITDDIIIIGGDGTIHFLANDLKDYDLKHNIYLYRGGTGNDFLRSIEEKSDMIKINKYIQDLPQVYFQDSFKCFVNGCGLGLDGDVCYRVNNGKKKTKGSFFFSAIKSFFKFKPMEGKITVDGKTREYKKIYLASIMNGKYQGGGMKMSPSSQRGDGLIEVCIVHNISRFMMLVLFPSIYKGKHIKRKKYVTILQGKEITVEMSKPTFLQIDGEIKKMVKTINAK